MGPKVSVCSVLFAAYAILTSLVFVQPAAAQLSASDLAAISSFENRLIPLANATTPDPSKAPITTNIMRAIAA